MGKKKIFVKTNILGNANGEREALDEKEQPGDINPIIKLPKNATKYRQFDFSPWLGVGIDEITNCCITQIHRLLKGFDTEVEPSTIASYCRIGLRSFLNFLLIIATATKSEIRLIDINRSLINNYLHHLKQHNASTTTQQATYSYTKAVLKLLGKRNSIIIIQSGLDATFPKNPFPNINRKKKGEKHLPKSQRQEFSFAVKKAIAPIWDFQVPLSSQTLAYALLIVALHTGRNTSPLLELTRDCLIPHPKADHYFLVVWKRRNHSTSKVTLAPDDKPEIESLPTIRTNVEKLIRVVLARSSDLVAETEADMQDRLWLFRSLSKQARNEIKVLTTASIESAIKTLVRDYNLKEPDGRPMRLNISRLRKTYANRIYELLDSDLMSTALALGNTPKVTARSYLQTTDEAKKNWRFLGEILVTELINGTIGQSYKNTPTGKCNDLKQDQLAPKTQGEMCTNFLNCVRCKHYAITGDDLYKLYSFYFRIYAELPRLGKRVWTKRFAHIPRLIDTYIIKEGVRRKAFSQTDVDKAKDRAREAPHPFWSFDLLKDVEVFA